MPIREELRPILVVQHERAEDWLKQNFDTYVRNYQEIAESGRRVFNKYTCTKKNPKNPDWPLLFVVLIIVNLHPENQDFFTYVHSTTIVRDRLYWF
jgi:hypothetical protein